MNVEVAEQAGFCFGVKNTIQRIEDTLSETFGPVWSIGLPVHNSQLTDKLKEHGLHVADSLDEVTEGVLIVRAHGLPPQEMRAAAANGVRIIDATCPFVKKAQDTAKTLSGEGYFVVLCGELQHPEVKAIAGCIAGPYKICTELDDVRDFVCDQKVAVLSQTTYSPIKFQEIVDDLAERFPQSFKVVDTICQSVAKRKRHAMQLAERVGLMLIVGGKMSSNTKRLYEAALSVNSQSFHIETKEDIDESWFENVNSVGITAGASTPDWLVAEVVTYCQAR